MSAARAISSASAAKVCKAMPRPPPTNAGSSCAQNERAVVSKAAGGRAGICELTGRLVGTDSGVRVQVYSTPDEIAAGSSAFCPWASHARRVRCCFWSGVAPRESLG